ncbi:MmcB family DNA repair protein [Sphingomonas sp. RS6]
MTGSVSPIVGNADDAIVTADVVRGVSRMLLRHDCVALPEVPLEGGRRADLMALDARGNIVIVEIKVSRSDLLGDAKWMDYLAHCDRFFWAVPQGFDLRPFDQPGFLPGRAGLIVADRYDAAVAREATTAPLASAARRKVTLAFARRAGRRLLSLTDEDVENGF